MKKKNPKFKIVITSSGKCRGWEWKGIKKGFNSIANVHISSWVGSWVFVPFLCSVTYLAYIFLYIQEYY